MVTTAFINALQIYLVSAGLSPVPKSVGVAKPASNADIPSIVLSLSELIIPSAGLGEHTEAVQGSLQVSSVIDLANPLLPADPGFSLLSPDRRTLTLYHGGLVDKDGSNTPLGAADIQLTLDGNPFTLVTASPASGEFSVSASEGQLQFGDPLPVAGVITGHYWIGQWERRILQLGGLLDLLVYGASSSDTVNLSDRVISTLALAPDNISGLRRLTPAEVGAVTGPDPDAGPVTARQRQLSWRFDYEHIVDRAESSGGIIKRIKLRNRVDSSPFEEDEIS